MASKKLSVETVREYLTEYHFTPSAASMAAAAPGLIGVELETYPYRKLRDALHPLEDLDPLFEAVRRALAHHSRVEKVDSEAKKIFCENRDSIQFEPGGQTELITAPVNTLTELSGRIRALKQLVKAAGKGLDVHFGQYGMQPWFKTSEVGLRVKNGRYRSMIGYFDNLSPFGRRMMLESSSLQMSLDLGKTTEQAVKRVKLANFLVPFATALFANSPNDAQTRTPYKTYRYHVWQNLDPLRSGTAYARNFNPGTTYSEIVGAYLQFVLKAPVIKPAYATGLPGPPVAFEDWLRKGIEQSFPDVADLKNHLSFLFPDVKIRNSLEIRSIDVTPEGWEFVPICFYCGILYDDQALDQALETLYVQRDSMEGFLKQAVYGLQSDRLFETGKELFRIAIAGYGRLPEGFKLKEAPEDRFEEYFREATLKRKTFADMQTDLFGQLLG